MSNGSRRVIDFSGVGYEAPDPVEAEERARQDHEAWLEWLADRASKAIEAGVLDDGVRVEGSTRRVLDFSEVAEVTGEVDSRDLLRLVLPPLQILVPDLLVQGTTVLAAAPKIGKSMLCYQLSVETALGGQFLGRKVEQGQVLYMALEDGQLRAQTRLQKALLGRKLPYGRLTMRWDAPPIGSGLETLIEEWLSRHPDARLVIVDTLAKVRPFSDGRRNAYDVDVQDLGALQNMMRDRGIVLLVVHHTRKGAADDFLTKVSGTYGVVGSADHTIVLERARMEKIATLSITGRELAELELALRFDGMLWADAPDLLPGASPSRQAVYTVIEEQGPIYPAAIARLLKMERTAVQHLIDRMIADAEVVKVGSGYVAAEQTLLGSDVSVKRHSHVTPENLPDEEKGSDGSDIIH